MKIWGFGSRNEAKTAKRKAKPSSKKRAIKRKPLQVEQPPPKPVKKDS